MEIIKSYINAHFKTLFILFALTVLSIFLLMIRLKVTHSFFYLFLVWNLFLAIIPFSISAYLKEKNNLSKAALIIWSLIWLLFIPNAPYMVTDLVHLRLSPLSIICFDILMILLFALTGLFSFYVSVSDMKILVENHLNISIPKYIQIALLFLVSFGVYLGRFLRFNSWDLIKNPLLLSHDIMVIVLSPIQNMGAWIFTFSFGIVLWLGHQLFQKYLRL